jgi:hypothetical protein
MIARLSDELVDELERTGGQPLRVENPRNHKLYVIVAEDQMAAVPRSSANGAWTEAKNARRFALIDKQIAGVLTPEEAAELASLTTEIDDYLRRVAPLPLSATRQLHEQLRRTLASTI